MRRALLGLAILLVCGVPPCEEAWAAPASVTWNDWSPETFARAKREGRLILVTVSASWCHWCHVMRRTTYADPRVVQRVELAYVPILVDSDARPDLAERFAEYHWPATVFLSSDARTILALRGYRDADAFLAVLDEVEAAAREGKSLVDAPPPGGNTAAKGGNATLASLRARLETVVESECDEDEGGWGRGQKYPMPAPVLHALLEARLTSGAAAGSAWRRRALFTLRQSESLLDPVWGGMFQYSEGGVWTNPHTEKIATVNAGAIACFASAYRLTKDERWRRDAETVRRWLTGMMRDASGAFFASQDADLGTEGDAPSVDGPAYYRLPDAERRRLGVPRIDRAVYAMENGLYVQSLAALFAATGDEAPLADAVRAANAILATHADPRGGFRHAAKEQGVLHLGDSVAMGHAFLSLHQATGERVWLTRAEAAADALRTLFLDRVRGGFFETTVDPGAAGDFAERLRPFEGNAAAARFLLALAAVTRRDDLRADAVRAIESVSDPGLAERFGARAAALLLAVEEALFDPLRVTVVAAEGDPAAALWRAALAVDAPIVVRERLAPDPAAGTPPAPSVRLCLGSRCSGWLADPAAVPAEAARLLAR